MGVPAAEQRPIFREVRPRGESREAGIKGTGIGLAMVKHIVAAHGGEIRLESDPGEAAVHDPLPRRRERCTNPVVEDEPAIAFGLEADLKPKATRSRSWATERRPRGGRARASST